MFITTCKTELVRSCCVIWGAQPGALCQPRGAGWAGAGGKFQKKEYMCMLCCAKSLQTPCDPMDCSPPGSSVHGILQARILEWVAMPASRGSSWPRDCTHISCISCIGRSFTISTTWEVPDICIPTADSCWWTAETNTSNYHPTENRFLTKRAQGLACRWYTLHSEFPTGIRHALRLHLNSSPNLVSSLPPPSPHRSCPTFLSGVVLGTHPW